MNIEDVSGCSLLNYDKFNFVLGKNGCGKSRLFRTIDQHIRINGFIPRIGLVRYITPERGGILEYQAGQDQALINDVNHLSNSRRLNRLEQFRHQSFSQFRKLERIVLMEIEEYARKKELCSFTFDETVTLINSLLDNIKLIRDTTKGFIVVDKMDENSVRNPADISSGESELISLAIESLIFEKESDSVKENILLFDEPDVHLHPDLQARFAKFLISLTDNKPIHIFIATHSTPYLAAVADHDNVTIAFMKTGMTNLQFNPISKYITKILPIFGAHPLSEIFVNKPILLVEGSDEERIWQHANRKSNNHINIWPLDCGGKDEVPKYEKEVNDIITSVYDNATGYSLIDGDGVIEDPDDNPPTVRFKLQCYSSENLIITDEVLSYLGTDWNSLEINIEKWLVDNENHPHYEEMSIFKESNYDRQNHNIKAIRNDLLALTGATIDWEIAVGIVIAQRNYLENDSDTSIRNYLGDKLINSIINN